MAATTATNLQVLGRIIEGYMAAHAPEQFSLIRSGIVEVDTNPPFSVASGGGNTYTVKGWINDTSADSTPTANTDMDLTALTSYMMKGVVLRRGKIYAIEDFAAIAGGVGTQEWAQQVAFTINHNQALNVEKRALQTLVPALFNTTNGVLAPTNTIDASSAAFDYTLLQDAFAVMGENVDMLTRVIMHPEVYRKANVAALLEARANDSAPDVPGARALAATSFVGTLTGGVQLFLNSRLYNTGGVYDTIVAGPGAMKFGVQMANSVTAFRDERLAGGTDCVKYLNAYGLHVPGTTWGGTDPAGNGGVTDADLGTATNWALTGDFVATKTPMVVIKSLATTVSE